MYFCQPYFFKSGLNLQSNLKKFTSLELLICEVLFLVYKLASYSFLVCACTTSCSYSLVLVVSSAVAFPTVSMLTTPSTKSSLSRSSVVFGLFFSFTRCFNCFLHFSSSNAKSMWPSLLIFFFSSEIPLLLREEISECKIHYSVNCLFKGILTVMLGSFLFDKNSMTCSPQGLLYTVSTKKSNQQIKHFMQQ